MAVQADLIVTGAAEALTFRGGSGAGPGPREDNEPGLLKDAAIAARDGKIVWVGRSAEASAEVEALPGVLHVEASNQVLLPGLIDCHSHFVYGGDRASEFAQRCEGASYLEIAAAGGGIQSTVDSTVALGTDALVATGLRRAGRLLAEGITTTEAKSGYALSVEGELDLLRAIRRVAGSTALEIHPTLLGLHAVPRGSDRGRFLDQVVSELIPHAAQEGLAGQFDAFLEQGAFTAAEVERAAVAARDAGMTLRLHADQLTSGGGAEVAAALGAVSADHLEHVSPAGIDALARAGTSAVLAPVATLSAQIDRFAPFRALETAGVTVALCTNWNPGSAPTGNVWLSVGLACLSYRIAPWKALRAFTLGGAQVLGQQARLGRLEVGYQADFALYSTSDHRHLASHWGVNHAVQVFKRGKRVFEAPPVSC